MRNCCKTNNVDITQKFLLNNSLTCFGSSSEAN